MNNKSRGYIFVLLAISIFAAQDAFTKLLGEKYPPVMVTMIRFWAFAAFVIWLASSSPDGLKGSFKTRRPVLQTIRGALLVTEILVVVVALASAGMAMTQAIFQATPLIVTLLSIPLLGEKVGWRRGTAIAVGLVGVLVILNPINVHFDSTLLIPLVGSILYAFYNIATRAVSRTDSAVTSVLYAGIVGAVLVTLIGPFYWMPISLADWPAMIALCVCGATSHFCLIKAYSHLTAVEVQPITYLQLVLSVCVAILFFGENISWNMLVGAVLVVGSGMFTVWREHRLAMRESCADSPVASN